MFIFLRICLLLMCGLSAICQEGIVSQDEKKLYKCLNNVEVFDYNEYKNKVKLDDLLCGDLEKKYKSMIYDNSIDVIYVVFRMFDVNCHGFRKACIQLMNKSSNYRINAVLFCLFTSTNKVEDIVHLCKLLYIQKVASREGETVAELAVQYLEEKMPLEFNPEQYKTMKSNKIETMLKKSYKKYYKFMKYDYEIERFVIVR